MRKELLQKWAREIRAGFSSEHPHRYDKNFGDLSVADLLLVLEDINYHTSETILTALATTDIDLITRACKILVEQSRTGHLSPDLYDKRRQLDKEITERLWQGES